MVAHTTLLEISCCGKYINKSVELVIGSIHIYTETYTYHGNRLHYKKSDQKIEVQYLIACFHTAVHNPLS